MSNDLQNDLVCTLGHLNEHLEVQAGKYAHYAAIAADATRIAREAKLNLEVTEAQIAEEARLTMEQSGEKPTEWKIQSRLNADQRRTQAYQNWINAQYRADLAQVATVSMSQRKDMLVTLAANLRGEMGGNIRVSSSHPLNRTPSIQQQQTPLPSSSQTPAYSGANLATLQQRFNNNQSSQNENNQ